MGYRVLGLTEQLMKGYGPRKGLEGPFIYGNGRILYYDPGAGQYYDPTCDWYVSQDEMNLLHEDLVRSLREK